MLLYDYNAMIKVLDTFFVIRCELQPYQMSFLVPSEYFCASIMACCCSSLIHPVTFSTITALRVLFAAGNRELAQQCDMKCSARLQIPAVGVLLQSSSTVCIFLFSLPFQYIFLAILTTASAFLLDWRRCWEGTIWPKSADAVHFWYAN